MASFHDFDVPPPPRLPAHTREGSARTPQLVLGLDGAGKTQVCCTLAGEEHDGTRTMGMRAPAHVRLGKAAAVRLTDVGGSASFRPIWPEYLPDTHAIVFVVDGSSQARLHEARDALAAVVSRPTGSGKPLLVLVNERDAAAPVADVQAALRMEFLDAHARCRAFQPLRAPFLRAPGHLKLATAQPMPGLWHCSAQLFRAQMCRWQLARAAAGRSRAVRCRAQRTAGRTGACWRACGGCTAVCAPSSLLSTSASCAIRRDTAGRKRRSGRCGGRRRAPPERHGAPTRRCAPRGGCAVVRVCDRAACQQLAPRPARLASHQRVAVQRVNSQAGNSSDAARPIASGAEQSSADGACAATCVAASGAGHLDEAIGPQLTASTHGSARDGGGAHAAVTDGREQRSGLADHEGIHGSPGCGEHAAEGQGADASEQAPPARAEAAWPPRSKLPRVMPGRLRLALQKLVRLCTPRHEQ